MRSTLTGLSSLASTDGDHVAQDFDAELAQQQLGKRSGSDSRGRLPRRGPLQNVARFFEAVLKAPARSAWPGRGDATRLCLAGSPASTGRDSVQFFQSLLASSIAMGEPMVLP